MEDVRESPTLRRDFLTTLRRRFWLIIEVTVAVAIAAALAAQVQTPIYRSTALIALMRATTQRGMPAPPQTTEQSDPKLQVRRITSATVLDRVRINLELGGPVRGLQEKITARIVEESQNSNVVAINATDADPLRAQRIANEVADVYIAEAEKSGTYATGRAIEFVDEQLASMREQLAAQERAIEDFKQRNPPEARQSDAGAGVRLGRVLSVDAELENIDIQIKELTAQLARTKAELAKTPAMLEVEKRTRNPLGTSLRGQISQLEVERVAKLAEYTEEAPEIRRLDQQIENLKQLLENEQGRVVEEVQEEVNSVYSQLESRRAELEYTLHGLKARRDVLERLKGEHSQEIETLPSQQTELARLERKRSILESLYNMLQSRYYELQIAKAQQPRTVELLQPASEPTSPVEPNKPMYYAVGLVLGVILGLIFAGLFDQLDDTFADVNELERLLRIPVLGQIPAVDAAQPATALLQSARTPFSDGIHMIYTNLRFLASADDGQVLSVTAADNDGGSTTTATNLAIAMAQSGNEVLLVDANWRTPALHKVFGAESSGPGLADVIGGDVSLEDVIRSTDIEGLQVLHAGTIPANPAAILGSKRGREAFGELSRMADFVVVDTPPAGIVPEASLIASCVGGVILVTDRTTKRQAAAAALRALNRSGAHVIGVVRNRERPGQFRQYYYEETRTEE